MGNIFNKILAKKPNNSVFDLSYDHKLSFKMGKLVPVHMQECVPGDFFNVSSEGMFRMMPMIAPIMHKVDIYMHHFFVPNRIIWDNWGRYISGGEKIGAAVPLFPKLDTSVLDVTPSSLANYLGLPIGHYGLSSSNTIINALPFAAYQRIWAEFYRDQNQEPLAVFGINESEVKVVDGTQDATMTAFLTQLRDRCWEHDYFTSCLPFAQKGTEVEVPLSLTGTAPLSFNNTPYATDQEVWNYDGTVAGPSPLGANLGILVNNSDGTVRNLDVSDNHYTDFDNANVGTTTTINDLRYAMKVQQWLEKHARSGSRYIESILAHFGVRTSDRSLNRPQYLGGSKATMAISEVLQTSHSESTVTPQGNMAGHGIGVSGGKDFKYFCEEHGFIIGVLSIRPKTAYYQGVPRVFSKNDRGEYLWPDFAHLGEQEVRNREIYMRFGAGTDANAETFGYIPRYAEYRYNPSRVSGQMADTLEHWHLGRKFASAPSLNDVFLRCVPDKRIFAVTDDTEDEIVAHIFHKIMAKRPLPKYGTPGGI